MRTVRLHWRSFSLPFRAPFITARGAIDHREGLIITLDMDNGITGLGEATALLELGGGSLQDLLFTLDTLRPLIVGKSVEDALNSMETFVSEQPGVAAVRCALDTALLDATAKERGIRLADLLTSEPAEAVPVNAIIGVGSIAEAVRLAAEARKDGFRTVKLKVGAAQSIEEESERVAAVREALGLDIALRLDANGAWTAEQAARTIKALEKFDLELVEQPVPTENVIALRLVTLAVDTPIATDESITSIEAARRVLANRAARALVVKPMVVGGLRAGYHIAQIAADAGIACFVTTTMDAGVGTAAALHLAAALPPGGPACGLATGPLLASDLLVKPVAISNGQMKLPEGPGLGIDLDEEALAHYGSGLVGELTS